MDKPMGTSEHIHNTITVTAKLYSKHWLISPEGNYNNPTKSLQTPYLSKIVPESKWHWISNKELLNCSNKTTAQCPI